MRRGEIWWVDLAAPRRAEPGYRRPGVIVSANTYNDSRLQTVIMALLTPNVRLAEMPGNVMIPTKGSGLARPSVVNVTQVATVDRNDLVEQIGCVPPATMLRIDEGLRLVLGL